MDHHLLLLLVLLIVSFSLGCESFGWFSSSNSKEPSFSDNNEILRGSVAEFSMEGLNNHKGMELVEDAKKKMASTNSCWQNAYHHLFAGCSEILAVNEKKSRLAWHLSDCFQRDSGRNPFPHCDPKSPMAKCLKGLDDLSHKVYLEFYLETNSICYQLQAHAFKQHTERLVNELKSSSQLAVEQLESINESQEHLLQASNQVYDSLNSIDTRTQIVAQTVMSVEDHVDIVLRHSKNAYEQTLKIAASQTQLGEGQEEMKRNLEDGMAMLSDSYNYLGQEVQKVRHETMEIEKEVSRVGDAMSLKMQSLQSKAEDIGNMAGISLDKQQTLLDGQSKALEGLSSLSEFQSKALEESRKTLLHFAEYGHKQQEELIQRQNQLQQLHDRLMENSKSILSAQESFESKQANMFVALDKLFALHNAMLLESRTIKSFFIYFLSMFAIYMVTSTKQTYNVRPWLYLGLCATLIMEISILYVTNDNIEQQTWIISMIRSAFMLVASAWLLYAICTYRDYEILNHKILLNLVDKVNKMEKHKELSWEMDSDVEWSEWIDEDLTDDVSCLGDPDYLLPEEIGEDSTTTSTTSRKYNLRHRNQKN